MAAPDTIPHLTPSLETIFELVRDRRVADQPIHPEPP